MLVNDQLVWNNFLHERTVHIALTSSLKLTSALLSPTPSAPLTSSDLCCTHHQCALSRASAHTHTSLLPLIGRAIIIIITPRSERVPSTVANTHTHTRAPTSEVFQLTGGSANSAAAAALVVAEEVALVTVQQCQRVATVQVTTRMNPWRRSALNPTQY